tara:strand:- start:492 stop:1451 length:960 start_codon:yes stop_codon:yes gene_type:complete
VKKSNIKLSILVPSFNDSNYIEECLNSILKSNSFDFEIIVCDDCSDEDTLKIINKFNDSRLRVFESQERLGATDNYKRCLRKARGKWVHFLHSDDFYQDDSVDEILDALKSGDDVYLIKLKCFEDGNNKIFDIQCDEKSLKGIMNKDRSQNSINLLKHFNHDELVLAIFPLEKFKLIKKLSKYSSHSSTMYWVLAIFHESNFSFINKGAVMKRYKHKVRRDQWGEIGNKKNVLGFSIRGFMGDLYNSFILGTHSKNFFLLTKLLFGNRYNDNQIGGMYGVFKESSTYFFLGPVFQLILGPFLIFLKKSKIYVRFKKNTL